MAKKEQGWDFGGLIKAFEADTGSTLTRNQVNRYLKEGILPQPEEGEIFSEHHLERLRMIEHLRSRYGISLRDISGLFGVIVGSAAGESVEEQEEEKLAVDRRERIIDNATELFAAKGYHGTTIDEIVQATGIAKGTFYIYFDSKEELLVEVIKRLIDNTLEKIDRKLEHEKEADFIIRLETKGQELLDLYLKRSELLYMLLGETVGNQRLTEQSREVYARLAARIEEDLRTGVEAGEIYPFEDLKSISYALVGMGQSIAVMLLGDGEAQMDKTWKTMHEFFRRTFSPGSR
ncbi:MAG: TetR family transcriptional regulator [Actinobacteria bacterium]|nr:TetR family transcriptional regulator [Actinomycetota bacterium]